MQAVERSQALRAKVALEEVCSGARLGSAPEFYSSHFVDHVNGAEHRGHEGIRRSVQAYARVLSDLRIERSEEHTSELQSQSNLVCRLLLEKKKIIESI